MALAFNMVSPVRASLPDPWGVLWGGNPVNGSALVWCYWQEDVTISTVTDSQSNSWVDCGKGRWASGGDRYQQIFVCANITGGTTPTVTVDFSGATSSGKAFLVNYTGADTSSLVDVYGVGSNGGTSPVTSENLTPSVTNGAIVAFGYSSASGVTAGANFTKRSSETSYEMVEDYIFTSSVGTTTATFTHNADGGGYAGIFAVVIKATAAGGTILPMMMHHHGG